LGPWRDRGRAPGERTFKSKRPIEANKNDLVGIDARSRTKHTVPLGRIRTVSEPIRRQHRHHEKPPRTFPHTLSSHPTVKESSYFWFEVHAEGVASSWEVLRQRQCDVAFNAAVW